MYELENDVPFPPTRRSGGGKRKRDTKRHNCVIVLQPRDIRVAQLPRTEHPIAALPGSLGNFSFLMGNGQLGEENGDNVTFSQRGNSRSYLLARLQRDGHLELVTQVKSRTLRRQLQQRNSDVNCQRC